MNLTLDDGVEDKLVEIASSDNVRAQREVARTVAFLRRLEVKMARGALDFWNVGYSASGKLTAGPRRPNGDSLWRLYAEHRYCIAILLRGDQIRVLAICNREDIATKEAKICGATPT